MLITCPECSHTVSDKAVACPSCGYPINSPQIIVKSKEKLLTRSSGASQKKYRKLPNGYGSIKKLSGRRRKPFAAYPPTEEFNLHGSPLSVPAIGYFETWHSAYDALAEYNRNPYNISYSSITFAELYELYYNSKYNNAKRKFSKSSELSTQAAFKNCTALHDRPFRDIRKAEMQAVVDGCKLKHASLELIVSLFHGLYKYAMENDIVDKDYSKFVSINVEDNDENGQPFTEADIILLWKNKDIPGVDTILIMIYSGFRISEFSTMEINLEERYFRGGMKTKAGKDRTVPIHPAIYDFVKSYGGKCFYKSPQEYRKRIFYPLLDRLGISSAAGGERHTPHDCRHTFSWLCDKYGMDDLSKHLLMGHSLGNDVEKSVYGHRTMEELRAEIEKIKVKG